MRYSYARFDELDRQAAAENWPPGWRMSHAEREANRRRVLDGRLDRDLWVFAYGSLIWDPAVYLCEIRVACLRGWHRRFCMRIFGGRGTHQRPGLMAALDGGGACNGVVFRIPGAIVDRETEIMWMREMFSGGYEPRILPVSTPQGEVEALAFAINRENERYVPDMPLAEAAAIIAEAEGELGPNFDYLESLQAHLAELGLEDIELLALHRLSARLREQAASTS